MEITGLETKRVMGNFQLRAVFEKINEIGKPLARLTMGKREKTQSWK